MQKEELLLQKRLLELSKIADEVSDENGVTWVPDKEHVYVAYRHQMVRTQLGMRPAESEHLYTPTTDDMKNMNFVKMKYVEKDDDMNELSLDIPFYTYPADWRRDETSRPYLVLVVNREELGLQDKARLLDRTKKIVVSREQNPLKFPTCLIGSL